MKYAEKYIIKARKLRSLGRSYSEIQFALGLVISKSTLSYWCKGIKLTPSQNRRINDLILKNMRTARGKALIMRKEMRQQYFARIKDDNKHLLLAMRDLSTARIALAVLYLAEGTKGSRECLTFGNSNPGVIKLFILLLSQCFKVDPKKYRVTVQCRADQDTEALEYYWAGVTGIPSGQFYKSRIDPRTIGKPSRKKEYKGVCRIDYFSADLYNELRIIGDMLIY